MNVKRFLADCRGTTAIIYAVALVPLFCLFGTGLDFVRVAGDKSRLQSLADSLALSAAKELTLAGVTESQLDSTVAMLLKLDGADTDTTSNVSVDFDTMTLTVNLTSPIEAYFPGPLSDAKPLSASATAKLVGTGGNVCMIGLNETREQTLRLNTDARITAKNCAIYSNSSSPSSLEIREGARVAADLVCVAGGIAGDATKVVAEVVQDCPSIDDPLIERARPFDNNFDERVNFTFLRELSSDEIAAAGCDHVDTMIRRNETRTLEPGVYCGGIVVLGGTAQLRPGEYVIKDGALTALLGGTLTGENVGFFLTGAASTILFTGSATIDLTAPKEGVLAGMLFFEDPKSPVATYHTIASDNARRLVGTIYIPQSKLLIAGNDPIADQSEYTIIVANRFELRQGPNLVLNTDYDRTDIPVPAGVGPVMDASVTLVE